MSIETSLDNLANAIRALAMAMQPTTAVEGDDAAPPPPDEAPRRGRGRPPKIATAPQTETAPPPPPVASPPPPVAPAPDIDKGAVQKLLIEVVKKHGKEACGGLCRKHGGPNLSALNPDVYPALAADATALLAVDADPAA